MNLNEYEWSRNPRGMHDPGNNHQRWADWGLGWMKSVFVDDQGARWAAFALERGVTPMTRIHRPNFSGQPMDDAMRAAYQTHLDVGVKWFEFYNEPNIPFEWPEGVDLRPDNPDLIRALCENWLPWAEFIINAGAYPGFMTLVENADPWGETTAWIISLCNYMFDNHYQRFRDIINNGMWLPTHPNMMNHWYQEVPGGGPLSTRQPEQVNHAEGGWHFEYPYDPICQADDPGRTVWGGTPSQPLNDVFGVLGSGIAWIEALQERFDVGWLPVVGTEGGIWRLPETYEERVQQDTRYPPYTMQSHAHGTVAMFDWIAQQTPPWMFGVCIWRLHYYWRNGNPIPAMHYLGGTPPPRRPEVPAIPALGDAPPPYDPGFVVTTAQQATPIPTMPPVVTPPTIAPQPTPTNSGPGPVFGAPELHFVVLAPSLQEHWFFESPGVRDYWMRFQPVIMTHLNFIGFLPNSTSLAISLVSPPEMLSVMRAQVEDQWTGVMIDIIQAGDAAQLDRIFRDRVSRGVRFS